MDRLVDFQAQRAKHWAEYNERKQEASVPTHSEYPKHMRHPSFQPGTVGKEVVSPNGVRHNVGGSPIKFPPVLVHNPDDEEFYAAKGYVVQGQSDAAAFANAYATAEPMSDYKPQQYPKWVNGRLVENEDEEIAALDAGPVEAEAPAEAEPERSAAELENEALKARMAEMQDEMRQGQELLRQMREQMQALMAAQPQSGKRGKQASVEAQEAA